MKGMTSALAARPKGEPGGKNPGRKGTEKPSGQKRSSRAGTDETESTRMVWIGWEFRFTARWRRKREPALPASVARRRPSHVCRAGLENAFVIPTSQRQARAPKWRMTCAWNQLHGSGAG